MKKYLIVVYVILTAGIASPAQVYIQTTLPTVGLVQKNQLWNLVLVNSSGTVVEGKLDLVLRDRQTGIEQLTATTGRISLPKGSLTVNVNSLNPVQYNYLAMDAGSLLANLLPAGNYIACYSFTRILSDKQDPLAEECVSFDTEPLSPPMLIFPADSAELDVSPSQFSWTPPTPAGMISKLQYEFLVTEVKPGQKPNEAIQDNMSLFSTAGIATNFMTYAASLPAFEKDKWYCWQVVARDDKNYAGKSETWVFKVKQQTPLDMIIAGTPYLKMKPETPETGIAPNGILKLSYFNRNGDKEAKLFVYDVSDADESGKSFITVKLVPGENQLQVNLKKVISISEEKIYRAEIVAASGEKNSVLFSIKNFGDK